MAYEMRPGKGSLFKNQNKTKDVHPSYKGQIKLPNGEVYDVSLWPKKTAAGDTWLSLDVQKEYVSSHSQDKGNGYQPQPSNDSDIPF